MQKTLNSTIFRKMINVGAKVLEDNKKHVDALNVFPVPDGDTGTNMSLTLNSAVKEINACFNNSFSAVAEAFSKGALKGARGNSGVIMSQIIKGMSQEIGQAEGDLTVSQFCKALTTGAEVAYKAVTKPKEGTILTVIRIMAESANKNAKKLKTFEELFGLIMTDGEAILQQTPEMLPVLKKAGVVDAGGRGLLVFFAGMEKVVLGEEDFDINVENMENSVGSVEDLVTSEHDHVANLDNLGDIEFGYCTEFMVTHMNKKTTESDIDKLRDRLVALGDSVVCVGDLELVKVHVHTNEPNIALGYALELGELINIKIDNMVEQNREVKRDRNMQAKNLKEFGMVAVAPGEGIAEVFKDLLVDGIIEGGQTMNPSASDIAKACDMVPAKNIFVFPNNKNIILAAEQAKGLTSKTLHVVPTKSVPEGVAAALSFNPDGTLNENLDNMSTSKNNVISASVTHAVRDTHIDGFDLKQGDIIGLDEHSIMAKGSFVNDTTLELVSKLTNEDTVTITLFYGAEVKETQAEELKEKLEEAYPSCDITIINGKQPVYYYIISIE